MKTTKATFGTVLTLALALFLSFILTSPTAFAADGDFDPTFGGDGKVTANPFGDIDSLLDIALQPDGKIVGVGTTQFINSGYDFSVVRYNPNGTLDTTFSSDGHVVTALSNGSDIALAVAVQTDGKLMAVGYCSPTSNSVIALARYNPDGSLDSTFGQNGKVCGSVEAHLTGVAIQTDGKIVASGYTTSQSIQEFVVFRFNVNGSPDTSFGVQGIRTVEFYGGDVSNAAYDVTIQPDGKIIAAGSIQQAPSNSDYYAGLVRLNPDGQGDPQFGFNGVLPIQFTDGDDAARAVTLAPDGKIYVAGSAFTTADGYDFVLARFDTTGGNDPTFSSDGRIRIPIGDDDSNDVALDIALQADGKAVAAGYGTINGVVHFALVRVLDNGALDPTFGAGGKLIHSFDSGEESQARGLAIQPDGKIIAGGNAFIQESNNSDYALARYVSSGSTGPSPTPTSTPPPGVTPTGTPSLCTIEYTDVAQGSTFYDFVHCLACRGVIGGYETGCDTGNPCFKPNNNLTRGQLSKIVSNAADFTEDHTTNTFEDVAVGSTFHLFIERLASRSIIGGYACGGVGEPCGTGNKPYFRPNANVTRGQTSKIVAIAVGAPDPPLGQRDFEDVPVAHTFWEWIEALYIGGVISGYPCGGVGEPCGGEQLAYFRPNANVTRGQSSKIITNSFFPRCEEQATPGK